MNTIPSTYDEASTEAQSDNLTFTGKLVYVSSTVDRSIGILVKGGRNPGAYILSSNLTGGKELALTALSKETKVYGVLDDSNKVSLLTVYSNSQ